ncbi:hypothetical protein A1507_22230 [Methylomonas koyamae]|uniref:Dynamin N-terminal domain-containing protein n=2 Tax=Methylomonas koyamae TaxID=702114 RepID=A0A177NSK0_9GAMM|nr:hypothetical protein A1507_22230 [Methylomonas koyamae]
MNTFKQLEQDFKHAKIQVETLETQFLDALSAVAAAAQKDPLSDSQLRQDHPLRSHIAESVSDITVLVSEWQQKIKNAERHTKFRERYGDSLLVFVYGKVKAGKSSFGNFIAYGKTDPSDIDIKAAEPSPKFFIEETTAKTEATDQDAMASQRQFRVGRTETTSAIQGFCLPGLTWVDSPGLHSKTEANGKLAQDYVNAADLVLFLSHANAPGRRSDLQEIQNLGLKNHALAVVITGSDTYEEDDAGNLIKIIRMMSDVDRDQQKNYVQQELDNIAEIIAFQHPETKSMLKEAKVFSVSAWYAERSEELSSWDKSGMIDFVNFMMETAQGRGIRIKKARPLENLRAFLIEVESRDLNHIETVIQKTTDKLSFARKEIARISERVLRDMRTDLTQTIESLANKYANDNSAFKANITKEYKTVWLKYTARLIEQYAERLDSATALDLDETDIELPEFAKHTETIRRKREINKKRGATLGTALFGGAAILLTGGMATPLVIGATLASGYAGDKLGEMAGAYFDSDDSVVIDLGDNREEVSIETRKHLINQAEHNLQALIEFLDQTYYQSTESWIATIRHKIQRLRQEIEQQRIQINSELSKLG